MNVRKIYLTVVIVVFALAKIVSAQISQTSVSPTQSNKTAQITQGPTIEYADDRFAVISWTTVAPSESRVFYGNDPTNLTQVAEGAPNTTTHRVHLSNLLPSTKYYFQVDNGQAGSPGQPTESFQTVAAGGQALRNQRPVRVANATPPSPVITRGPTIQYADDRSAVISWTTDRPAPTVVYYGTDASYLDQTAEQGTTATTSHRVHLHNLSPRTTYFFQVDTGQTPGVAMTTYNLQTSASGAPPVFDRAASQGTTGTVTVPQTNASQVSAGAPSTSTAQTNTPADPDTEQSEQPVLAQRPRQTVYKGGLLVPAGTEFSASLDGPLSSKASKPGDEFTASITQPVRAQNGTVALPSGTRLRGQVSNVEQGKILASVRGKARMDLRFTEVVLPNGTVLPVTATLLGVGQKTGASTGQEGEVTDKTQGKEVAKDVGIGAGLGTVAGLIFGSALKGLAIGAIAGGGYVLATQGRDVQIPADSQLNIRLDHQLSVPPPSARTDQQQTTEQQPDTTGP